MNISQIKQMLEIIGKVYGKRTIDILDESQYPYTQVLPEAIQHAERTWRIYQSDRRNNPTWGYEIPDTYPLSFKRSEVLNGAHVDIYCDVKWGDGNLPVKQDIKIRIWSEDETITFRPGFDSEDIWYKLNDAGRVHKRRVISRFHFDKADHSQGKGKEYHPEYHVQVGGVSREYELCWHPHSFDIPRIPHHPMELFLTCQLVAANFFPEKYVDISQELIWLKHLHSCQKAMLLDYYQRCVRAIDRGESLLDFVRST